MLEPTEIPGELRELEKELACPPTVELSQELRARVMESVHENLERKRVLPSSRWWVGLSAASVAAAAAVMLIVAFFASDPLTPLTKPNNVVEVTSSNEDVRSLDDSPSRSLPTLQHYRLALSTSSADWEVLLHRETDLFEDLSGESQAFKWRQGTSSLRNDDD